MNGLAFGLYLLFICSWFLHLPARLPALGALRIDLLLIMALMAFSFALPSVERSKGDKNISTALWILLGYTLVSVPFVEWPGSVVGFGFPTFFKAFVFFHLTRAFVGTPKRLKVLVAVFIGCQLFRILEPLYLHVTEGYWGSFASMAGWEYMDRLSGAPHDVVNPNGLAFVVLTTLPLLHYVSSGHLVSRLAYLVVLPAMIYTLLLTGSRSGLVGLAAIALLILWKSKHKVVLSAVVAVAVVGTVPYLSPEMRDRYLSIWDSNTKNAVTAEGRVSGVSLDLEVAMRRPIFGHGLGTSREANANFGGRDQPSHNLYTEILQELGAIGLLLFLNFVRVLFSTLRSMVINVRSRHSADVYEGRLATALQVWMGMNLLFSFAAYGLSGYEWYLAAGLTIALDRLSTSADAVPSLAGTSQSTGPERPGRPAGWPPLPSPGTSLAAR
jgi:putative inorganic carbon (HCO3(-)) transporter